MATCNLGSRCSCRTGEDSRFCSHIDYSKEWKIKTEDPIVNSVISKYQERSRVGFKKYKTSMRDNPMELKEWLTALQEELMDATNYIERIIYEVDKGDN